MAPDISIVAIGDEVLLGMTLNRNAQIVALGLTQRGWAVSEQIVVPDTPHIIDQVLRQRLLRGAIVFAIGGLGSTLDDHTRKVVAGLFQRPLVFSSETYNSICRRFGAECTTIRDQSLQPQGAVLFENASGTSPGFFLEDNGLFSGAKLFVLPGPTLEMEDIFYKTILPSFFPNQKPFFRLLKIYGSFESDVDPILRKIQRKFPQMRIGLYPAYDTVTVLFSISDQIQAEALVQAEFFLKKNVANAICLDATISLEEQVFYNVAKHGWTLATAESCTGGSIASRMVSVPGVSEIFSGGIVAYQNSIKKSLLQVSQALLDTYGVVSQAVTEQMATSARTIFQADVAVATSGDFGPSGSGEVPIGTVCYTIHTPAAVYSATRRFIGNRSVVCEKTVQAVLSRLCLETL